MQSALRRRPPLGDDVDQRERAPDPLAVEAPKRVPRALRATVGARDVEAELVADAHRLQRPEDRGGLGRGSLGGEREPSLGPIGVEGLLDLRPLIGSSHRRISIMAAR